MKRRKVFDGQRSVILAIFVCSLFVNLLVLTAPLFMLQLFSRVMTSGSIPTLIALFIGAMIALVFFFAFDSIRQRLAVRLGVRLEASMGPDVMTGLVNDLPLREALGTQPVRDLQELRNFVSGPFFIALLDAPWSVMFVAVIFLFHFELGLIALFGIAALFALGVTNEILGRGPNRDAATAAQRANRTAEEMLRNSETLRAMGKTPALTHRWRGQSMLSMVFGTAAADRIALMGSLAKFVRMSLQVGIMAWGVVLVLRGDLSPGLMIAASILLGRAAAPVEQSITGWKALMSVRQSIQRLELTLARADTAAAKLELPAPEGHLAVEDLTVILPELQNPVLMNVSFALKPGASLGIIGPSGAGKTTLARCLVGLKEPSRGHVRIDDASLGDWPADQIGRYIGFLPQRVELFDGTVAENIAMMDEAATPAEIVAAAKRAEVHNLILTMPHGYNTPIGPDGERLSAGQRQRIGLARAFYGDRRLIVLDEPNANLDPEGEEALARAIANATARGSVVIVVTHRLSLLRRVSHAAVMEAGRLVRFGPARDVLEASTVPMTQGTTGDDKVTVLPRRAAASPKPQATRGVL
ncbi:MAG: type I secretion system permease/ATPase [Sedimentitalea sp.]|nr:type I secretion system permease/ATPase [Sedimentitalea sp.]